MLPNILKNAKVSTQMRLFYIVVFYSDFQLIQKREIWDLLYSTVFITVYTRMFQKLGKGILASIFWHNILLIIKIY